MQSSAVCDKHTFNSSVAVTNQLQDWLQQVAWSQSVLNQGCSISDGNVIIYGVIHLYIIVKQLFCYNILRKQFNLLKPKVLPKHCDWLEYKLYNNYTMVNRTSRLHFKKSVRTGWVLKPIIDPHFNYCTRLGTLSQNQ